MLQTSNLISVLRYISGSFIAIHGLYRIVILKQYAEYVSTTFDYLIPFDALFQALVVIFPFVEFFIGTLLFLKIAAQEAVKLSIWVTGIILFFLFLQGFSSHIFYHLFTMAMLVVLNKYYSNKVIPNAEL